MGVGIAEVFVLLGIFLGSSFGLPMGVAPGPEDPMMFKIAPEKCVFYACWMGIGELDKEASPTEAWMAQPEIQVFMDKFRIAFRGSILDSSLSEKDNPTTKAMTRLFLGLAETAMRNPTAF